MKKRSDRMDSGEKMDRAEFIRSGVRSIWRHVARTLDHELERKVSRIVIPLLRPPGAVAEHIFLLQCKRCAVCAEACPHHAIKRADEKYGMAMGTPMINPVDNPCRLCEGFPCIQACPEGALVPAERIQMGTAHIVKNKCLTYSGQVCDYCFDRCPLKGEAIRMESSRPIIMKAQCSGCGVCVYYCPAPGKGVTILPGPRVTRDE